MKLSWKLHQNPIYNSDSPLYLDLSRRFKFSAAEFSTYLDGGFGDGSIEIENPTLDDVRSASSEWLMKRIVASDDSGRIAYEGFVAEVNAQIGYHNYRRTIDSFANRIFLEYQWGGSYAGVGKCPKGKTCKGRMPRNESDVATSSTQTDWGIIEAWTDTVSNGVISPTMAQNEADRILLEKLNARALDTRLEHEVPSPSISLTLWGYYATLNWRKQSRKYKTATEIATIVSQAMTTGSKAQFIDTSTTALAGLATTGATVKFNGGGDPIWLLDYIRDVVANGDSNKRRIMFQIWEGRKPYLTTRGTAPKYFTRSDDERMRDSGHAIVPPYMVRAGGIIVPENADFALDNYSDSIARRYAAFIEQTTWDDVNEVLTIPAPTETHMTTVRMLANVHKRMRENV